MKPQPIEDLISRLSLEEKVGQMTQVNLNVILKNGGESLDGELDPAALKVAAEKNIGSILNAINRPYPPDLWRSIIDEIQDAFQTHSSSKIPVIYGIDSIHGATYVQGSTLFPQNIGLGATRNPQLVAKTAEICARQTKISGIPWNFDPVLDVGRNPLWPRFPETFGESPFLASHLGIAKMNGYTHSKESVANCVKHFAGYGAPDSGKDRTPAHLSTVELHEIHLEPFRKAIRERPSSVMLNSSEINGEPVHASYHLLTEILRDKWGFEGPVISDWEDILRLHTRHRIAESPKQAVKFAVNAGVDISMVPHGYSFHRALIELVQEGEVPEKRIDEAVGRILKLKEDVGLLNGPTRLEPKPLNRGHERKIALDAARESMTLLKNQNQILPLSGKERILVAGPAADSVSALHGGWSYTWQGDNRRWYPENAQTVESALKEKLGEKVISLSEHAFPEEEYYYFNLSKEDLNNRRQGFPWKDELKDELRRKAEQADCIVLCLGENSYAESPGVIDDLTLPHDQIEMAETAIATGKPCILVLVEGRPRIIRSIADGMEAILLAYQPGSGGAEAIAETLLGENNPSGILPFTYPAAPNDMVLHDHKYSEELQELRPGFFTNEGYHPEYPLGHGLSYTDFEIKDLRLDKKVMGFDDVIVGRFTVENIGPLKGKKCIDLFIRDLYASVTPPVRRLKKVFCTSLNPSDKMEMKFEIREEDLEMIDHDGCRVVEEGGFEIILDDVTARFAYERG